LNLNFKINLDKEPMVFGQETMPILMEINFFKSRRIRCLNTSVDNTFDHGQKIYPIAAGGKRSTENFQKSNMDAVIGDGLLIDTHKC
jgi:hypothetical protein